MKRGRRFSFLAFLGLALVVAGLLLIQEKMPTQYAFLTADESAAKLCEQLGLDLNCIKEVTEAY